MYFRALEKNKNKPNLNEQTGRNNQDYEEIDAEMKIKNQLKRGVGSSKI